MTALESREALRKRKIAEYLSDLDDRPIRVNYSGLKTEQTLLVAALNDWSGQVLAEGGDIRLTYACNDPCCATLEEAERIATLLHHDELILYPISECGVEEQNGGQPPSISRTSFRIYPHTDGSCASGVRIAKGDGIRDVDAALRLWVMSVVEDCMAYMVFHMNRYGLHLEAEEAGAVRTILTSAVHDRFTPGQIYNALWRTVKDAAANSTLQYSSSAKAAKGIPKKLDKLVDQAGESLATFRNYDRIPSVPLGALLTLFQSRFRIGHHTTRLEACNLLLEHRVEDRPEKDIPKESNQSVVTGTFHFLDRFTPLDRLVITHFNPLSLSCPGEPEWGQHDSKVGQIGFVLRGIYDFDGNAFVRELLPMLGVDMPSQDAVARHAAAVTVEPTGHFEGDPSGLTQALEEALAERGLPQALRTAITDVARLPVEPSEVLRLVRQLPLPSGLVAIRADHACINDDYIEKSSTLSVQDLQISLPQAIFGPDGNDTALVAAVLKDDEQGYAALLATGAARLIGCDDSVKRAQILHAVSRSLVDIADRLLVPPVAPASGDDPNAGG